MVAESPCGDSEWRFVVDVMFYFSIEKLKNKKDNLIFLKLDIGKFLSVSTKRVNTINNSVKISITTI